MNFGTSNGSILIEDEAIRDGLQMEARIFNLDEKLQIFNMLKEAGIPRIQVGSFVHPKIVPQMADTDVFIKAIPETDRHLISALILKEKGLERSLTSGVGHVSMSVSVSDTHSRKNARRPAAEALDAMTDLIRTFDTCTGGLGGCPFVKGAAGNLPTEDAFHMLESMRIATGIAINKRCDAVALLENKLDRQLPGRMKRVLDHRKNCE